MGRPKQTGMKTMMNTKTKTGSARCLLWIALAVMLSGCATTRHNIPPEVQETLFKEADQAMAAAKEAEARKWAPKTFQEAEASYNSAKKALVSGKSLNTIRKRLAEATGQFSRSKQIAENSAIVFKTVIDARADAQKANAEKHDSKNYLEGESALTKGIDLFESGDTVDAKKAAAEAETYFRNAELYAVKVRILGDAWRILENAEEMEIDDQAPNTLRLARKLAAESEQLIEADRYVTDKAEELAARSEYETAHAIYLFDRINDLKDRKVGYELILKEAEAPLEMIGEKLGIPLKFDEGLNPPTQTILDGVEKIQMESSKLAQEVITLENKLNQAKQEAAEAASEKPVEDDTPSETEKAEKEALIRETAAAVKSEFEPDQAMVFENEDENLVITLAGLTFSAGDSRIDPKYYPLLDRIARILSDVPYQKLIVQGHTDALGSFAKNLQLSYERALAVKAYFVDKKRAPHNKIETSGFGESLPVADNETREGRKKNRRIEIVVVLE